MGMVEDLQSWIKDNSDTIKIRLESLIEKQRVFSINLELPVILQNNPELQDKLESQGLVKQNEETGQIELDEKVFSEAYRNPDSEGAKVIKELLEHKDLSWVAEMTDSEIDLGNRSIALEGTDRYVIAIFKGERYLIDTKQLGTGKNAGTHVAVNIDNPDEVRCFKILVGELQNTHVGNEIGQLYQYDSEKQLSHGYVENVTLEFSALKTFPEESTVAKLLVENPDAAITFVRQDYIPGDTVESILASGKVQKPMELARIIVDGLKKYHEQTQAYHRDLHPGNMMLRVPQGDIVLIDPDSSGKFDSETKLTKQPLGFSLNMEVKGIEGKVDFSPPEIVKAVSEKELSELSEDEKEALNGYLGEYGIQQEIYMLGVIFKLIGVPEEITKNMTEREPRRRYQRLEQVQLAMREYTNRAEANSLAAAGRPGPQSQKRVRRQPPKGGTPLSPLTPGGYAAQQAKFKENNKRPTRPHRS